MDGHREFQEAITVYLRGLADWRRRKADEYDRDTRNLRSAMALEELAIFVRDIPDDDSRIQRLRELSDTPDTFRPGQQTAYEIGRFRFFNADAALDPFLDTIVELSVADAGEQGRFGGRMVPGDDPWN
jgi:hypothetical protein